MWIDLYEPFGISGAVCTSLFIDYTVAPGHPTGMLFRLSRHHPPAYPRPYPSPDMSVSKSRPIQSKKGEFESEIDKGSSFILPHPPLEAILVQYSTYLCSQKASIDSSLIKYTYIIYMYPTNHTSKQCKAYRFHPITLGHCLFFIRT